MQQQKLFYASNRWVFESGRLVCVIIRHSSRIEKSSDSIRHLVLVTTPIPRMFTLRIINECQKVKFDTFTDTDLQHYL